MRVPVPFGSVSLQSEPAERHLDLAVVVATFNERENVPELIAALKDALNELAWELVIVDDDSPDGTAELVGEYARRDSRIRLVHRVGRRGLASACIEGVLASSANFVAVMDGDMQHDERVLPSMLGQLREFGLDIVVGTRNAEGGSMGAFPARRRWLSRMGQRISHSVCRCYLSDPMSGFFLVRRSFFMEVVHRLRGGGFKILVDMLAASQRPVQLGEVGYKFRGRLRGESKLDVNCGVELLFFLANKLTGDLVPARFAVFALVGSTGLLLHLMCLLWLLDGLHWSFIEAQSMATFVAMTANFFINNVATYRDRSLRGSRLVTGLLSFWLACSFGAWANVSFAHSLLLSGVPWFGAGLAGITLGSVWNYAVSSLFTWHAPQQSRAPEIEDAAEGDVELLG